MTADTVYANVAQKLERVMDGTPQHFTGQEKEIVERALVFFYGRELGSKDSQTLILVSEESRN